LFLCFSVPWFLQAPPDVNILGDPVSPPESSTPRLSSLGSVDLVVNGSVIETKLSMYGKVKYCVNFLVICYEM